MQADVLMQTYQSDKLLNSSCQTWLDLPDQERKCGSILANQMKL